MTRRGDRTTPGLQQINLLEIKLRTACSLFMTSLQDWKAEFSEALCRSRIRSRSGGWCSGRGWQDHPHFGRGRVRRYSMGSGKEPSAVPFQLRSIAARVLCEKRPATLLSKPTMIGTVRRTRAVGDIAPGSAASTIETDLAEPLGFLYRPRMERRWRGLRRRARCP